jgi:hypothetical protein
MDHYVSDLARARTIEVRLKERASWLRTELDNTILGQQLAETTALLKAAQLAVTEAYERVKSAAIEQHQDSGTKQPHPAVKVVISTILQYDVSNALDYARQHLPQALKLDRRTFEKAAKAIEPDFVSFDTQPSVRVARDLSAYLTPEGDASEQA